VQVQLLLKKRPEFNVVLLESWRAKKSAGYQGSARELAV
jgi:hypothetical protein